MKKINSDELVCGVYTQGDILECIDDLSLSGREMLVDFMENLLVAEYSGKVPGRKVGNS